jgi:hypothetical protein
VILDVLVFCVVIAFIDEAARIPSKRRSSAIGWFWPRL